MTVVTNYRRRLWIGDDDFMPDEPAREIFACAWEVVGDAWDCKVLVHGRSGSWATLHPPRYFDTKAEVRDWVLSIYPDAKFIYPEDWHLKWMSVYAPAGSSREVAIDRRIRSQYQAARRLRAEQRAEQRALQGQPARDQENRRIADVRVSSALADEPDRPVLDQPQAVPSVVAKPKDSLPWEQYDPDLLITPVEFAKRRKIPPQYVYGAIYRGKLTSVGERPKKVKIGDALRVFGRG